MAKRFQDKVVVVTGAARGMGAIEARLFAGEGARVFLCDLLDEEGRCVAAEIAAGGGDARYRRLDVATEDGWWALADEAMRDFGGVDVLVNNAGINVRAGIEALRLEDWHRVLGVNLLGALLGMRALVPAMRARGGGAIVNICSVAGLRGSRSAAYGASKWGLRGLSRVAALEFAADRIRVNTICPGVVPTSLNAGQPYLATAKARTPLRRLSSADDVARAALFLASDEAGAITGVDLPVDGGITVLDPGSVVVG